MKDSAVAHEADQAQDQSSFEQFAKVMRALVAVPKRELAEKLEHERLANRKAKRNTRE